MRSILIGIVFTSAMGAADVPNKAEVAMAQRDVSNIERDMLSLEKQYAYAVQELSKKKMEAQARLTAVEKKAQEDCAKIEQQYDRQTNECKDKK